MTRYERAPMPPGLDAVAHVDGTGEVVVYLAENLTDCAAEALVLMTNAARNAGWPVAESRHLTEVDAPSSVIRRAARIGLLRAFVLAVVSFFFASGITAAATRTPAHHTRLSAPAARHATAPDAAFSGSRAPLTEVP
jgi:hypothetical protein